VAGPALAAALLAGCGSASGSSTAVVTSHSTVTAAPVISGADAASVPCTGLTTPLPGPAAAATRSGDRLPGLSLSCLGGGPVVRLADLRGPAVLNVWASWCGPCAQEIPYLLAAHRALGPTVRFVGLDLADDPADARAWNALHQVDWPSLRDPDGSIRGPLRVPGPPVTFFIGSDGGVIAVHYGAFTSTDDVRQEVARRLGQAAAKGTG